MTKGKRERENRVTIVYVVYFLCAARSSMPSRVVENHIIMAWLGALFGTIHQISLVLTWCLAYGVSHYIHYVIIYMFAHFIFFHFFFISDFSIGEFCVYNKFGCWFFFFLIFLLLNSVCNLLAPTSLRSIFIIWMVVKEEEREPVERIERRERERSVPWWLLLLFLYENSVQKAIFLNWYAFMRVRLCAWSVVFG